jgi:hypothetical protein
VISPRLQLPTYSLLTETPVKRRALANAFRDIVAVAKMCLGAKEVRQIVTTVTRAPRGKRAAFDRNRRLLEQYDAEAAIGVPVNIPELARRLYEKHNRAFGASSDAIEKHLRRLLREREKQCAVAFDATQKWYGAMERRLGFRPTSILGSDK